MGIMDTTYPASKDVGEVALVVNDTLQDNREIALAIDGCLDALEWAGDGDMGTIHSARSGQGAYAGEAGNTSYG
ncbi:hypothetical protein Y1Q_0003195 [Alligator mississippiensis]|uniref:Uncharacterized protein n=1 Tax=Alligator mississippiensis TaxID=8496 RepID=A0A151MDU4_ALLMI|nr:hypothetical protein Y1Q_0003195 [Alligator mississippiensis]